MEYYIVKPDLERHFPVGPSHEVDLLAIMDRLRGVVPFEAWTPIRLEVLTEDPYEEAAEVPTQLADLMDFNATGIHVISERARAELGPVLGPCCHFLPVSLGGQRYYLNHVTTVLDALDASASEVERFESGNIKSVGRYVLNGEHVERADMFRLLGIRWQLVLASQRIMEVVQNAGLTGFTFLPVEVR